MKKLFLLIILLLIPIKINALTYPELNSKKAIIYNLTTNEILYEKDSDEVSSIASLTKIMTTIVSLENIEDLNEKVTITQDMLNLVRWDASIAGLKAGDVVTYEDLLYASILPSGADATIALAISTSGSIKNFTDKMNELAERIGMENSHFVNVHGLDAEGHYSTAKDILTLLKYCLNNPKFKEIYTTKTHTLTNNLTVKSTLSVYNKNNDLDLSRILGSKTGFTQQAGRCISALINSDNQEILIILLKAEHVQEKAYNLVDALSLIDFIDDNYNNINLINKNDIIESIKVENSKIDSYDIKTKEDITLFLPIDYNKDDFKIEYKGINTLSSKNKINEELGTISYYYKNELLKTEKVYLEEKIDFSLIKYIKNHLFGVIIIIAILILALFSILLILKKEKRRKLCLAKK